MIEYLLSALGLNADQVSLDFLVFASLLLIITCFYALLKLFLGWIHDLFGTY